MSQRPPGSIDILREEVKIEREAQLRQFDSIDSKSGIVLGFAGALAALAPLDRNLVVDLGRLVAVGGAQMLNDTRNVVIKKVRRLEVAMVVLATAALLVGVGSLVE